MSYWKKCLSTGDYQFVATGEPAPGDIAESPPVAGSETEPEPDFTGRVAELEAALKLAMDWLEDDVPKHIVDKLINSLR